ncbi:MAG: digeranylgeranylglycerophospholipid reductase [Candidatus Altiarchaeales archaeon ex4484_2]|nr:MAG: digeranylgeranylglycerophospholipid reductase [Candidatus Altiarchaeales archaeon ex4484_2]
MDEYDVVVVGAGPAGSTAARFAAEKARVLLVDKHREIGSPKRCGEGLTLDAFRDLDIPLDKRFINKKIYGSVVYAPGGGKIEIRYDEPAGYIIERKIFDKFLAAEASRKGVRVLADAYATLNTVNGRIMGVRIRHQGEEREIKAKVVIAADGVESQIARQAGINTALNPRDIDSCFEYEMSDIKIEDPNMIHAYLGNKIAPGGYIWIFPKDDDRANVGVGVCGGERETAKYYLDRFIKSRPDLRGGSILEVNVGCIPVGASLKELVRDNLMVVGDAARQVNPVHAGGVHNAMLAGKLAGTTAAETIDSQDLGILKRYELGWNSSKGKQLERILRIRYFMRKLGDGDMDYLTRVWDGGDLIRVSEGDWGVALKKMAEHPRLLKLLKKFV